MIFSALSTASPILSSKPLFFCGRAAHRGRLVARRAPDPGGPGGAAGLFVLRPAMAAVDSDYSIAQYCHGMFGVVSPATCRAFSNPGPVSRPTLLWAALRATIFCQFRGGIGGPFGGVAKVAGVQIAYYVGLSPVSVWLFTRRSQSLGRFIGSCAPCRFCVRRWRSVPGCCWCTGSPGCNVMPRANHRGGRESPW